MGYHSIVIILKILVAFLCQYITIGYYYFLFFRKQFTVLPWWYIVWFCWGYAYLPACICMKNNTIETFILLCYPQAQQLRKGFIPTQLCPLAPFFFRAYTICAFPIDSLILKFYIVPFSSTHLLSHDTKSNLLFLLLLEHKK